jgi:hypothetical protein
MKKQPSRLKSAGSSQKRRQRKVSASLRSQSCSSYRGMEIWKTLRVSPYPQTPGGYDGQMSDKALHY